MQTVKIVDYSEIYKKAFAEINIAWITKDYELEEEDQQELFQPEKYILNDGGAILIAIYNNEPVGTCALINGGNGIFELVKMAVTEKARGLKIGRTLGEEAIKKAKELGCRKLILHSNTKTSSLAVALYRKLGFVEVPLGKSQWKRADIRMEIILK